MLLHLQRLFATRSVQSEFRKQVVSQEVWYTTDYHLVIDDFQCSHAEDYAPCQNCASKGDESELNVSEQDGLLLIICDKCNYSEKFDSWN